MLELVLPVILFSVIIYHIRPGEKFLKDISKIKNGIEHRISNLKIQNNFAFLILYFDFMKIFRIQHVCNEWQMTNAFKSSIYSHA